MKKLPPTRRILAGHAQKDVKVRFEGQRESAEKDAAKESAVKRRGTKASVDNNNNNNNHNNNNNNKNNNNNNDESPIPPVRRVNSALKPHPESSPRSGGGPTCFLVISAVAKK